MIYIDTIIAIAVLWLFSPLLIDLLFGLGTPK